MKYREFPPTPSLKPFVSNYWQFEIPENTSLSLPIQHDILPENKPALVLINHPYFQGIRILGPQLEKFHRPIVPPAFYLGIRFQPWVISDAIFPDRKKIINQALDPPSFVLPFFAEISFSELKPGFENISFIENCLEKLLVESSISKNELIQFICLELEKGKLVSKIVEQIPLSIRPIQKQFKTITGITMKQYANIVRMQNTWREMVVEKKEYLEVILDNGYYDQPHFINSFRKVMKRSHNEFYDYHAAIDISIS